MEAASIITIIMLSGLFIERILKHFKSSKCCGSEVEFNENASVPDFSKLPLNKK
jgi:hypothetical protein